MCVNGVHVLVGLGQAAQSYQRALRRAAWYAAGGTLGALAVYGLIRMHQRSRQQLAAAGAYPDARSAKHSAAMAGAHLQTMGMKPSVSTETLGFR